MSGAFSHVLSGYIRPIARWYSEINSATLTGAIDVIVVEQEDGSYLSSPFHVRFGKLGVLKAREKIVDIEVNRCPVALRMKLDDNGAAFFVECYDEEDDLAPELATSPLPDLHGPLKRAVLPSASTRVNRSLVLEFDKKTDDRKTSAGPSSSDSSSSDSSSRDLPDAGTASVAVGLPEGPGISPRILTEAATSGHKGLLNRKKRRRRSLMKQHIRKGSKASFKVESNENDVDIFNMEDVSETGTCVDDSSVHCSTPLNLMASEHSFLSSRLPNPESFDSVLARQERMTRSESEVLIGHASSCSVFASDVDYFSEPEQSISTSPMVSRPPSPVLSDSGVDSARRRDNDGKNAAVGGGGSGEERNWEWGQLPSPLTTNSGAKIKVEEKANDGDSKREESKVKDVSAEEGKGILSYLFGRGSGSKKSEDATVTVGDKDTPEFPRQQARNVGGVYLDDLKDADQEMLEIYVGSRRIHGSTTRDGAAGCEVSNPVLIDDNEDAESGNGPSLPMSPHSVEGAVGGTLVRYEGTEENVGFRALNDVDISLCGGLVNSAQGFSPLLFAQNKLTYDGFVDRFRNQQNSAANNFLFDDPNMVVRIGVQYYTWRDACPLIMASVLYGRSLPSDLVEVISGSYQETSSNNNDNSVMMSGGTDFATEGVRKKRSSTSWWPFRSKKEAGDEHESPVKDSAKATIEREKDSFLPEATSTTETDAVDMKNSTKDDQTNFCMPEIPDTTNFDEEHHHISSAVSSGGDSDDFMQFTSEGKYRKTLRLSTESINKLNLRPGPNEVQFSVTTAYQGTTRCSCHIYLWKHTDKIVVSDIDGTITKSDVLGHVLPIIGRDWAQSGVASLFTKIKNNGYHIAYLSARAIGQASITKDYLNSVSQGDMNLPDGPLLLNPTSLVNAFHREVIVKKPEEFKIACLRDIQKLFPREGPGEPFYAGYGNRLNDVWAYRAVGIPTSRIFTINSRGELRLELTQTFQTSYLNQSEMVDHIFPPHRDAGFDTVLNYSTFTFWRQPLPDLQALDKLCGPSGTKFKTISEEVPAKEEKGTDVTNSA